MKKVLSVLAVLILATVGISTDATAKEHTLRIGSSYEVLDWDPQRASSEFERELKLHIFGALVTMGRGGEWLPCLAKSWEVSEDGREIVFHLGKGVQFHKGYGELTAEDVKFTMERVNDPKWELAQAFEAVDKIEIIDKYTLKVYLEKYDATFWSDLSNAGTFGRIIPKATQDMSLAEVRRNPIGTGPYELESWMPTEQVVLRRFEAYHGQAPYFDKVVYITYPERATLELALEKGEIDLARLSYAAVKKFQRMKEIEVYTEPGLGHGWIGFNVTRPPFDDVRVRRAIRYAIDVDEILQGAFEGIPERANAVLAPEHLGNWEGQAPVYKPDREKARELLAEAGFTNGLTATFVASAPYRGDLVASILIEQLKAIGVRLDVRILARTAMHAEIQAGNTDMYYADCPTSGAQHPFRATNWWISAQVAPHGWNLSKWSNEEFDELRKKAMYTPIREKQAELLIEMQRIMDKEVPAIWVHHGLVAFGYRSYLEGLEGKVTVSGLLDLAKLRMQD